MALDGTHAILKENAMKNRFFLSLALATLLAAPAVTVQAWAADPHTIAMTGHGEVRGAPDQAQVSAGVTTTAATAAQALTANSVQMKGVFAALEKMGVAEKNIQTVNFSIFPQYSNGENNSPRRLTGYQVSNEVSVRLDDVTKLGGTLDALVTAGANQMNGISFSIRAPAPLLEKARSDAIADARARAETYARAAGVTLGPILSISEGGGAVTPRPMYRMAMAAGPVPIAAGEQSITADVSVVWEIH